jgi:hypothetical protein
MLRKSRLYFSAIVAAVLLASLLMTSSVKACEEAPQSFLSLYMNSDLVVIARYDSESEAKKANEDEYGYSLETERKLVFTKVFKGQRDLRSISFPYSQYVSNPSQNTGETEETVPEYEEYFDITKIKIGGEYLFFLTKNKETGVYSVTDYTSGVKEIDKNLSFYEKNLSELERIVAAKENQYELLTEWIVRSIENKDSREDGIADLSESFYGLTYQEEDAQFKGKGPFVVSEEGYGTYTVGVAKHLTQSQKDRVSAVLYQVLEEAWSAEKPQYVSHGISAILGGINKSRLAQYTYNFMQSGGKSDFEKRRKIGEFLTDFLGDEAFSNLHYEIAELEAKIEEAKAVDTPQGNKQIKDLTLLRDAKLKELDKQFKFLQGRNFVPVENKTV